MDQWRVNWEINVSIDDIICIQNLRTQTVLLNLYVVKSTKDVASYILEINLRYWYRTGLNWAHQAAGNLV